VQHSGDYDVIKKDVLRLMHCCYRQFSAKFKFAKFKSSMSKFNHLNKIPLLKSPTQYSSYIRFRHLGFGCPKLSQFTWTLLEATEGTWMGLSKG